MKKSDLERIVIKILNLKPVFKREHKIYISGWFTWKSSPIRAFYLDLSRNCTPVNQTRKNNTNLFSIEWSEQVGGLPVIKKVK